MHAFYQYICKHLGSLLRKRRVVVFYDPCGEFAPFIDELAAEEEGDGSVRQFEIEDMAVRLARFQGSFFGLRGAAEPFTESDTPDPMLLYLPGVVRDRRGSLLMELEKAGDTWEPGLKRLARNLLLQRYTEGIVDGMLAPEQITYSDVVAFLQQEDEEEPPSLLKVIFVGLSDGVAIMASWLADASRDVSIEAKESIFELYALILSRLGLGIPPGTPLPEARNKTVRYVLVNEFRSDLQGEAPSSVSMIPVCPSKEQMERVRRVAEKLRKDHSDAYTGLADTVETELALSQAHLDPSALGSIDTFRFEERILLSRCGDLIAERDYEDAMRLVRERAACYWIGRDLSRRAQWEACGLMADLGCQVEAVKPELGKCGEKPEAWVNAYAAEDGWCRVDMTHRMLETWVSRMDGEPETEKALGVVRREYEELLAGMAEGFSKALCQSCWSVPNVLQQSHIYPKFVQPGGGRVAFFLVDAMRFEMGVELHNMLKDGQDVTIKPAVASLPTITPVGMAALLPGASGSLSVVEHKERLASKVEGTIVSNSTERMKFLKARVPGMVEMTLGKVLESSAGRLTKALGEAPLVVVRSQEIDALGEGGDDWMARQVMDTVVPNIARAVRKLAACGIGRFVITADHGYQFSLRKGEDMRMDSPGGATVEIHRRCWAGHGGVTPPGAVRVSGAELGYDTDLDFVFPATLAVFKCSGGLGYHHGGSSLQEMIVPVISLRLTGATGSKVPPSTVKILNCPGVITNRAFVIQVACDLHISQQGNMSLRVVLVSGGELVGVTGMVDKADFDRSTGCITLTPGEKVSVGMMLRSDECRTLRVVVQDPATDAVLAQSNELPVKLGI